MTYINMYRVAAARSHQDQRLVPVTHARCRRQEPRMRRSSIDAKEHSHRQDIAADEPEGICPWKVSSARNRSLVVGELQFFNIQDEK